MADDEDFFEEEKPPQVFSPTDDDITKTIGVRKVPAWFYAKEEDVCGLTKAAFIWWSNLVCAVFHLFLALTTIIVATRDGKGMDTPKLTVYLTNLTWQANSTDALIPQNVAQDGLLLAHMTMWFFLLSFLAHTIIVVCNYTQAMALNNPENRRITLMPPTGWYFAWIQSCRQPLRWIECTPRHRRSLVGGPTPSPIVGRLRMQTRPWHSATETWRGGRRGPRGRCPAMLLAPRPTSAST